MAAWQTGRFARAFVPTGGLGQGGFGRVYRARHGQSSCAVKVIPAELRSGETIETVDDVWSGGEVFDRLRRLSSPNVLRYYDYWLEEENPLDFPAANDVATTNTGGPSSVSIVDQVAAFSRRYSSEEESEAWEGLPPSPTCAGSSMAPDGFEWDLGEEAVADAPSAGEPVSNIRRAEAQEKAKLFLLVHMELCEGVSLHEWLWAPARRASAGLVEALGLGKQLLDGLVALSEAGIVHRDIKPANILLEAATGRLRILDFGLSRVAAASGSLDDSVEASQASGGRTSSGCVGTPGYAAPEQCALKPARPHPSADVFAAGVVLLELLAAGLRPMGSAPVWGTAMERASVLQGLRGGVLVLPPELLALPARLRLLLSGMTDPMPSRRPAAQEARAEVEAALRDVEAAL